MITAIFVACAVCAALAIAWHAKKVSFSQTRPNPSAMSFDPLFDPTISRSGNLTQLQNAKAGIANLRNHGVNDPDVDIFESEIDAAISQLQEIEKESEIDAAISQLQEIEKERIEALKRERTEQQDDICPECGQPFACNNDYICNSCRAKVG